MSTTIITSVHDRATPVVIAIADMAKPERLKPIVGRAVVNLFRAHLIEVDKSRPNWLGGKRTHFYLAAARGTHFDFVADGVMISVNQVGIRQRVVGGTIKPKKAKWLTIPVHPDAHGKRAREFDDLYVVFDRNGMPVALARAAQTAIKYRRSRKTGAITGRTVGATQSAAVIMYRLVKSVTQRPDPTVVPAPFDIGAAAFSAINAERDRQIERARQQSGGPN